MTAKPENSPAQSAGLLNGVFRYSHDAEDLGVRLWRHFGYIVLLVCVSLIVGTAGFHGLTHGDWYDAFLNSSMLLGGMGPVGHLETESPAAKVFAAFFALYSGLVFLIAAGLLFTPVMHDMMRRFHEHLVKHPVSDPAPIMNEPQNQAT